MPTLPVPTCIDDVTADWLTRALAIGGGTVHAALADVSVDRNVPRGLFADLTRLRLNWRSGEATRLPATLMVKLSSTNPEMRARPATQSAYRREVDFYRHLAADCSLPTPSCYYADYAEATGDHVIVLEDLAPAQSLEARDGCTPSQAMTAVTAIAGFHAEWWDTSSPARLTWMSEPSPPDAAAFADLHDAWWPSYLQHVGERLSVDQIRLGEKLRQARPRLQRALFSTPPRTLIHRDYSIANMTFATAAGGHPFTVIDWQSVCRGRGAWDLAWFAGQSLTIDQRRALETDLLEAYLERFNAQVKGTASYHRAALLHDYRLALLQRHGSLISTIAAMPMTPRQLELIVDVMLPRNLAAIADNDAAALL